MTIGIVGAGICGLMAARELKRHGHDVWLVESAARAGGRMATLRAGDAVFDSGAQFFTARDAEFSALVEEMRQEGIASEWFRGYPSNEIVKKELFPRYCGARGMTSVTQYLAGGLPIHLNSAVTAIDVCDRRWHVTAGDTIHTAGALILTPPVPQSLALLDVSETFEWLDADKNIREALGKIRYEPCWGVAAQLDGPSRIAPPGALHIESGPVSWIADNHQKGISPSPGSVTIHARGDWTNEHLEDDSAVVTNFLLAAAHDYLGADVIAAQAHLWRHAKPHVQHYYRYSCTLDPAPIFFAGDAFIKVGDSPRVESAVLSGIAAAREICMLIEHGET